MTFWGIIINISAAILGIVFSIWWAIEECDDHPILGGIAVACIWSILQITVNHVIIAM